MQTSIPLQPSQSNVPSMLAAAQALADQIAAWRRDFHMHPELGFEEYRTAERIQAILAEANLESRGGVARTGVVASLGSGKPAIGLRADMDALPIHECNSVPYASCYPGRMHACGHDTHMAMLLGAAGLLSRMVDRPTGEIRFIFQPSEEKGDEHGKSGGAYIVEEGVLDGLDAVIALHISSELPTGYVQIEDGYICAAADTFSAVIKGTGGHGAYPHQTVDPTYLLAHIIQAIHGIRARRIDPLRSAVISIGEIQAGNAPNVIPGEVKLRGTIRSFEEDVRQQLLAELERAFEITRPLGGDFELRIVRGVPAVYNDRQVAGIIRQVAAEIIGSEKIDRCEADMGAEDFSLITQAVPGAMFTLGAKLDGIDRPHHRDNFDIDESALPLGTAILTQSAVALLRAYGH